MFCSSCGTSITPELNYCKSCGVELSAAGKTSSKASESMNEALVLSIVGVTVGGLGVIIGLMAVMKNVVGFSNELILAITLLSFFLVLVGDAALIWMLLSRSRAAKKAAENKNQLIESAKQKLYEAPARELAEPMPMTSITEHTTRTLDAIPREQKKQ